MEKMKTFEAEHFTVTEYPDDIAAHLLALAFPDEEDAERRPEQSDMLDALQWLEAAAENPYNKDHFRVLYRVLENITDNHRYHEIKTSADLY